MVALSATDSDSSPGGWGWSPTSIPPHGGLHARPQSILFNCLIVARYGHTVASFYKDGILTHPLKKMKQNGESAKWPGGNKL